MNPPDIPRSADVPFTLAAPTNDKFYVTDYVIRLYKIMLKLPYDCTSIVASLLTKINPYDNINKTTFFVIPA